MSLQLFWLFSPLALLGCQTPTLQTPTIKAKIIATSVVPTTDSTLLMTGAEQDSLYLSLLQGKKVGLVVNQTSQVNGVHLVDKLLEKGISVQKIFAPEHGFRGDADAGATIANGKDINTGLPIMSLYGSNKKPSANDLADIDLMVFDIQDVGVRFYTYISTLYYVMDACATYNKPLLILDRPNPNGHYVDGFVLEPSLKSFVGVSPIPIVHGLTVGEYAQMVNGEKWLPNERVCDLKIVTCAGYTHNTPYELPIPPSPNLTTMRSVYLYPSLCFFEGTCVSVGRGTDVPFQCYGHPSSTQGDFTFTPNSNRGNKAPMYMGKACVGYACSDDTNILREKRRLDLSHLLRFYTEFPTKSKFFLSTDFFDKLAGTRRLKQQVLEGKSETEIRASWQSEIETYKIMRRKYLLYPDFE